VLGHADISRSMEGGVGDSEVDRRVERDNGKRKKGERLIGGFLVNKDRGWIGGQGRGCPTRTREGDKSALRDRKMSVSC
jgi:hypothetical protein